MIKVIGIGPGDVEQMTQKARTALEWAEVIVGYGPYIALVQSILTPSQDIVQNGMKGEVARCQKAVDYAKKGKKVAVISSGDAGIYGMASLILELSDDINQVEVIAGVTAANAAGAILGAPVTHDSCLISLSDLLTPMDLILKRVRLAAEGDFVISLYNPRSKGRPNHLKRALDVIREVQGNQLIVGVVHDAGRIGEYFTLSTIDAVDIEAVGMTSIVVIGNQSTYIKGNRMITPRGYHV